MPLIKTVQMKYICDVCESEIQEDNAIKSNAVLFSSPANSDEVILRERKRVLCNVTVYVPKFDTGVICKGCFKLLMYKHLETL